MRFRRVSLVPRKGLFSKGEDVRGQTHGLMPFKQALFTIESHTLTLIIQGFII